MSSRFEINLTLPMPGCGVEWMDGSLCLDVPEAILSDNPHPHPRNPKPLYHDNVDLPPLVTSLSLSV